MQTELKQTLGGERIIEGLARLWRSGGMTTDMKAGTIESIVVPTVLHESVLGAE